MTDARERAPFTAGEWLVVEPDDPTVEDYAVESGGDYIAECIRTLEDARAIAAVPELVAALQNLIPRFERACVLAGNSPEFVRDATEQARAALAKAGVT